MTKLALSILTFCILLPGILLAQQKQIRGKVTDDAGAGIADVAVSVKGTNLTTKTAADGNFTLTVPEATAAPELIFSHVSYGQRSITANGADVALTMQRGTAQLDEVVVIGYGTQKKRDITGAVATFKADNLDERSIARVDQALVGQMAGVRVKQTSGVPGKGFSVQVRGTGSISAATEPLYVIDGFPLEVGSQNGSGNFSNGNPLDNINPNDIESISVLKDASAQAIYGSRGSNGVVLITTKKGREGRAKITFNTYTGYNQAVKKLDILNGPEWIDRATEYINNSWVTSGPNRTASQTNEQRRGILGLPAGQVNIALMTDDRWTQAGYPGLRFIDWQDEFFRKGMVQNHNLSASGGTSNVKYFISGDYLKQEGIAIGVDYKRYSMRANVEVQASNKLKFGLNISPSFSVANDPGVDTKDAQSHLVVSHQPVVEANAGILSGTKTFGPYRWGTTRVSPVAVVSNALNETRSFRTLATAFADYTVFKGLALRSSLNFDNTDGNNKSFRAAEYHEGSTATSGGFGGFNKKTFVTENTISYNKLIGFHNISAVGGFSYNYTKIANYNVSGGTYGTNVIQNITTALNTGTTGTTSETDNSMVSFYGRAQYNYNDRYLVEGSLRRDASSRFGLSSRWGTFPAGSVGWRISEENFMKPVTFISDLKLRASWGLSGNNGISDYAAQALLSGSNTSFGGVNAPGQAPANIENRVLGWEEAETKNFGLDIGVLRNRVYASFEVYTKNNRDLLLSIPVPRISGFGNALVNIGEVKNKGWEVELNTRNTTGKFLWNTSLNLSHNQIKVLQLGPNNTDIENTGGFNEGHSLLRVGQPLNVLFLVQEIGVLSADDIAKNYPIFPNQTAGDPKYLDANGDKKIDLNDRILSGDPAPNLTWGITNTFKYKGFDLNVLVQGQNGGLIYSLFGRAMDRTGMGYQDNPLGIYRNRYRSETDRGDGTTHKTPTKMGFLKNTDWRYSSDYWRVRNITLGYDLGRLFKSTVISGARLYATAENLFGRDKYYGGFNPEAVNTGGEDYGGFPLSKGIIVGLNVTF